MRVNRKGKRRLVTWTVHLLLLLISLICILPILWMCLISIKPTSETMSGFQSIWVYHPTFANFKRLFAMIPIAQNAWNSVFTTLMGTVTSLFFCALAGFAFAKYQSREGIFCFIL